MARLENLKRIPRYIGTDLDGFRLKGIFGKYHWSGVTTFLFLGSPLKSILNSCVEK
jgi:hypothetical protein